MKVSLGDKTKTNYENGNKMKIYLHHPLNRKGMSNLTVSKLKSINVATSNLLPSSLTLVLKEIHVAFEMVKCKNEL